VIATKHLELRKRRGLMVVAVLLTVGLPVLVLGLRLIFHAADPKGYGPAGGPGIFQDLFSPMDEFGFIIAATLGAAAGTTDMLCQVTSYAGTPQPAAVNVNGVNVPAQLSEAQLKTWLLQHPGDYDNAFVNGPPGSVGPAGSGPPSGAAQVRQSIDRNITTAYADYISSENGQLNPAVNEMVKIGLRLALDIGLGALTGQRTVSTVLMIVLTIIVTPILARTEIPYFINGQRLVVGVARPSSGPRAWRRAQAAAVARATCCSAGADRSAYRRCPPGR
jgi:hypothetical protein